VSLVVTRITWFEFYFQNWVVRSASEVEQNIVSVERILHQIQEKSEAPYEIPSMKPTGVWPSKGVIEFK
jgi:ATP-binding cassette subfamily C (CFTR/MRP) protein 1